MRLAAFGSPITCPPGGAHDRVHSYGTVVASKTKMWQRLTKDALKAALNAFSIEVANKMKDRNQSFFVVPKP